jgi:peptidyl-prolyl cis-trans isomerase C
LNQPKFLIPFLAVPALVYAQAARNNVPPETVVAVIEGKKMTAEELTTFVNAMPGQMPSFFERDPKEFTRQLAMLMKLAKMAEAEKLEQQTPYKQRLDYARANVLMQSLVEYRTNKTEITESDVQAYYDKSKSSYAQAFTKVLYVSFGNDGKPRTEAEAKAKIEDLRKQAAEGADFGKLIAEHSEDAMTKSKGGDYPPIKPADAIPQPIKQAIFALQPGGYTEPIKQANGFYVFRLEKYDAQPIEAVREQIIGSIRQERFGKWFQEVRDSIDVKFENEEFFQPGAGGAAPINPALNPATNPAAAAAAAAAAAEKAAREAVRPPAPKKQ